MLRGGCFCGGVRYEATGEPFHAAVCHCVGCRRVTGAPAVAWFSVPRTMFRFTAGTPTAFRSSTRALRRFCPRCGTHLTFEADAFPDELDITTASLDDPDLAPPRDHIWVSRRPGWVALCDGLPAFPETRTSEG